MTSSTIVSMRAKALSSLRLEALLVMATNTLGTHMIRAFAYF